MKYFMPYVIGLDIGTSSSKAIVVDVGNNRILSQAVCEHELIIPRPLHAEQWLKWGLILPIK